MRVTFVHPAIGRRPGVDYMRTWQMEPLPIAALAAHTPRDVDVRFYDDRMEQIAFDEPTDLVAIPVETYTAKRAYQIASEYRRRRVPVVMGGFHAMLAPEEVADYAESIVLGEAEGIWGEIVDDARHGVLKPRYRPTTRPSMADVRYDRSILSGRRYLPIGLIETGRGCRFPCEFCAIQTVFERTARQRPVDAIAAELRELRRTKRMFFFVDDNFAADLRAARELLQGIEGVGIRWVTQMSINAAHDESFVEQLARSGCRGVLIGFESLDEAVLAAMRKRFNTMKSGFEGALANLRRHGIRVYGTFIFGYDGDRPDSFDEAVEFAIEHRMYLAAFNHLTPFPGTPLYRRLEQERRLTYDRWWLDDRYRYNELPFVPQGQSADDVRDGCLRARRKFYGLASMLKRGLDPINRSDGFMFRNFFMINGMHRAEVSTRDQFPLGDTQWRGRLLQAH